MLNVISHTIYIIDIILLIIILILLIIYKTGFISNDKREGFITWFRSDEARPKVLPKTYTCRKHYIKQDVIIGTYDYKGVVIYSSKISDKITDLLLYQSNISHISSKSFKTDELIYHNLHTGKVDLALVSTPVIYNEMEKNIIRQNYKPINFIASMNAVFIYFIVSEIGNIKSIKDINNRKRVGIDKNTSSWLCAIHIFNHLGLVEGVDYIFINNYYVKNSKLLNNGKLDCLIHIDVFPSPHISKLFMNDLDNTLRLLPLEEIHESDFTNEYKIYTSGYINLHQVSINYTPKVLGQFKFTTFKPMLKTYMFHNYLLGSQKTEGEIGLSVVKTIFDNIANINKLPSMTYTPFDKYNLVNNQLFIDLNKGVVSYYYKKGYITDYNNDNCKYLVGNKPCSKENLAKAALDIIV